MVPFRVWAPYASRVELGLGGTLLPMRREAGGWFAAEADAPHGTGYAYRLDGAQQSLPDPRSPWQPQGVHGASAVLDHSRFRWTDGGWQGMRAERAVVYELHVGTFTPEGTFESAIEKLDHLVSLGVTAVQIMPVAEFSGERGWGYDGVDLYAPHDAYGGPDGLKLLVDALHGRGLAAILDVVYNHVGPEGNYLERFGPYFTDRHTTPWGNAVNFDGAGARPVRDFVVENALMWLRDYHFDGLRLDAVHAIVDDYREHILAELARRVSELEPRRLLIAEEPKISPRLIRPRSEGGYGLDAQWDDELHHALHVLFTGENAGYYAPYPGTVGDVVRALLEPRRFGLPYERFVSYAQTHDQVGNRAAGERLAQLAGVGAARICAALVLLSPFVPMIFMGEEWGASTPFQFFSDHRDPLIAAKVSAGRAHEFEAFGWKPGDVPDPQDGATFRRSKLDWSELDREPHRGLLDFYRGLLRVRRGLRGDELEVSFDERARRLTMTRGPVSVACDFERQVVDVTTEARSRA